MATAEMLQKATVALKVNAGTDASSGRTIRKTVSMGYMAEDADKDKIMLVVAKLAAVLEYSLLEIQRTTVTVLETV